ncbi:MAG: hypothetical protein JXA60_03250 [Candidatus Coatesbacteria bacterium]|nr:hypothetical protein [Candidatus Coatesbacteria bacterium]
MSDNSNQPGFYIPGGFMFHVEEPSELHEEWIPVRSIKECLPGNLHVYDKGYRYMARLVYDALSLEQYKILVNLCNQKKELIFWPDKTYIYRNYKVRIGKRFFFPYLDDRFIAYKGEILLEGVQLKNEITYRYRNPS